MPVPRDETERITAVLPFAIPQPNDPAGVHGDISRFVTTIKGTTVTYHFFELEVKRLDDDWLEKDARNRKWVTFADAVKLVAWKEELAQALYLSSLAPSR